MSEHEERLKLCKNLDVRGLIIIAQGNPMCTILRKVIPEKLYTAADLEQARADERARCIHIVKKAMRGFLPMDSNYARGFKDGMIYAMTEIEDLGPIGETREETEKRVRREVAIKISNILYDVLPVGEIDAFKIMERIKLFMTKLNAIAEEKP
jgi:hypothetical protein